MWPESATVVQTPIATTSYDEVLHLLDNLPADRPTVFHFCNVHSVMEATKDSELAHALNTAEVNCPDGMPLVWTLRKLGFETQSRVYGPDLMERALIHGVDKGWSHYFYGATESTLEKLKANAETMAPGITIAGMHAPPFRPQTADERAQAIEDIRDSGAQIVWVGIGMPKQEKWIADVKDELPGVAFMGVGAAFDMHAGTLAQAPDFLQDRGLEWAYRLAKEPRRLWKRYATTNAPFVVAVGKQLRGRSGR